MLEILVPPTEITGAREKRETTGTLTITLGVCSTISLESTITAAAVSGLASTLTSII